MLVARRVSDNAHVVAVDVDRGPEFRCPDETCNQLVFIRKGRKLVHHFAHQRGVTCAYGSGETDQHLRAKLLLRDEFRRRGFQVDVEKTVLSCEGDRRADVLVRKPDTDQQLAIEVQHSYLSIPNIERRTKAYIAAGIPVMWIGIMKWTQLPDGSFLPIYNSGEWEEWAHDYNEEITDQRSLKGHLWFLDLDLAVGKMWRVQYPRDQQLITFLEGPFDVQSLRVKMFKRGEHRRLGPTVAGLSAWLLPPEDYKPGIPNVLPPRTKKSGRRFRRPDSTMQSL